jgi:peptidoglycan hydrolase-like protein with peptidoglycan-binding domain
VPNFVCQTTELKLADLRQIQAYYTLRHAQPVRREELRIQYTARIQSLVRQCASEQVLVNGSQRNCIISALNDLRQFWLQELQETRNSAALEEAQLSVEEFLRAQQALKSSGLLSANAIVDGVYGSGTREALARFQTERGIIGGGFLTGATLSAGLLLNNTTPTTVQSRPTSCPSDRRVLWHMCYGTYIFSDNTAYVGEFKEGTLHGQGSLFSSDGRLLQNGVWDNGQFIRGNNLPASVPPAPRAPATITPLTTTNSSTSVRLTRDAGTFKIPVRINGVLELQFTVDSGASDVTIPADVVMTLIRTGTISDSDFIGEQTYRLADGSTVKSRTFRIRQLQVGTRTIENVLGSVANVEGSLLLGQSFLSRFRRVSFDYEQGVLVLE